MHTHIKGLGLSETGEAISVASGLVGQDRAREVCRAPSHPWARPPPPPAPPFFNNHARLVLDLGVAWVAGLGCVCV